MEPRPAPLAQVTLVFGALSIPLAFLRHLCTLAVVVGVLAIAFNLWTRWRMRRGAVYGEAGLRRSFLGFKLACVGTALALVMWVLWATNVLLR